MVGAVEEKRQITSNPEKFGRVAVLMGGSSAERAVSLRSGAAVYDALKRKGVDAVAIDVTGSPIDALTGIKVDRVFILFMDAAAKTVSFRAFCRLWVFLIPAAGLWLLH